jgi:hypothetical protein
MVYNGADHEPNPPKKPSIFSRIFSRIRHFFHRLFGAE